MNINTVGEQYWQNQSQLDSLNHKEYCRNNRVPPGLKGEYFGGRFFAEIMIFGERICLCIYGFPMYMHFASAENP